MKRIFAKIVLFSIISTLLITISSPITTFATTATPLEVLCAKEPSNPACKPTTTPIPAPTESTTVPDLKEATFDVSQILNLDNNAQGQSYFDKGGNPPIIELILNVIEYATLIIGSIAMVILIIAGFQLMIAQGNQQKIDEGKDTLKYAIIGLVITFLSYVIVIFVQSLFITSDLAN